MGADICRCRWTLSIPRPASTEIRDSVVDDEILAVDAVGVDTKENIHAVTGPAGNLSRCYIRVEPEGNRSVAQVVRTPGER